MAVTSCPVRHSLFLALVSIASFPPSQTQLLDLGHYAIPGINRTAYVKNGDLNIGTFLGVYTSSIATGFSCDSLAVTEFILQKMEAFSYAVERINNDTDLLTNVSMGFVVLDECGHANPVLAQSLSFLPRTSAVGTHEQNISSSSLTPSPQGDALDHYDVIGVVSPSRSDWTSPISQLYSTVQLPIMGYKTGSDELSDKNKHRYFMRVVPPDKYQVMAMLRFIYQMNWSYISVLYHAGTYGEPPYENIKRMAPRFNICIAASHKVDELSDMGPILKDLLDVPQARVVILFTNAPVVLNLFEAVRRLNATGKFIWLGSNAWAGSVTVNLKDYALEIAGGFMFQQVYVRVPDFEKFYRLQNPTTSSNPWLASVWENLTTCSPQNVSCSGLHAAGRDLVFADDVSHLINSILAFAHAADRLLKELCPNVTGKAARTCITGESLLRYLLTTSFSSYTGLIHFDDKGDMTGKYWIKQIVPDGAGGIVDNLIATYDINSSRVEYVPDFKITWEYFNVVERVVPLHDGQLADVPESVCSRPCVLGEFKILKKLECCWDCRTCRPYERILHEKASCESCPEFHWPTTESNFTVCQPIPLSHPSITGSMSILFITLGILALVAAMLVLAAYVYLWEVRVIKASSRELSILQLVAIMVGYLTIICFQTTPTPVLCSAIYYLFCLSFVWLYSPLLVKAVRIFRIFQSGAKYDRRPKFVSSKWQVAMAIILIAVQLTLCIAVSILYQPSSTLTQPVATEKFVELSCDMTLPGLTTFLAYNLVLVALCAVFAFKTRKLPDNFNESRFMSMCVSTTLVIWLAFIPTYVTAIYQYVRVLLLSAALLLNHTVALVFLFVPKIYAGICLPQEETTANPSYKFQTSVAVATRSSLHPNMNRVAPQGFSGAQRPGL